MRLPDGAREPRAPDGRTIKIGVARAKAQSPDPGRDPLVYLTGGPGGTALGTAQALVQQEFGINRDRDVIFVDQRGTLHADPLLSCPEIDHFVDESTGMSILAAATAQRDLDAVGACRSPAGLGRLRSERLQHRRKRRRYRRFTDGDED